MELAGGDAQALLGGGESDALLPEIAGGLAQGGGRLLLAPAQRRAARELDAQVSRARHHDWQHLREQDAAMNRVADRSRFDQREDRRAAGELLERGGQAGDGLLTQGEAVRLCALLGGDDGDARLASAQVRLGLLDAGGERGGLVAGAVGGGAGERGAGIERVAAPARIVRLGGGADQRGALLGEALAGGEIGLGGKGDGEESECRYESQSCRKTRSCRACRSTFPSFRLRRRDKGAPFGKLRTNGFYVPRTPHVLILRDDKDGWQGCSSRARAARRAWRGPSCAARSWRRRRCACLRRRARHR